MHRRQRHGRVPSLLFLLLAACAATCAQAARDDLRQIVQQRCLPDWLQRHDPAPCLRVELPAGGRGSTDSDDALLADRKGGAHLLLIPLRTLGGIESPALLRETVPNYFAAAWNARDELVGRAGRPLRSDDIGLAINSRYSRGQDQLHIHIECQGAALHAALLVHAGQLGDRWIPVSIEGETYWIRRVRGATLASVDPFKLLAAGVPDASAHMAFYTLIVAGVQLPEGAGFALLARRAFLHGGEALLDSTCAIAGR